MKEVLYTLSYNLVDMLIWGGLMFALGIGLTLKDKPNQTKKRKER